MIGKVVKGERVGGLLRYLFGPGQANEHTDPHLAAAWDPPAALEPPAVDGGRRDVRPLTGMLEQPVLASPRVPAKPVWHCVLRTAPSDRALSDAEWDDIARHVLDRTGLAPRDDDAGCRWVAVRHAEDHVHLVVTLARQDGRPVSTSNDFYRLGQACREVEQRYGLTGTAARDRTAPRRATRGEQEKAQRASRDEPPRVALRREVQRAAAASCSAEEFFTELARSGVLVRRRLSERDPGVVTGYAVAVADDRSSAGEPVWFGGGKLAADLSWPTLQARWAQGVALVDGAESSSQAVSTLSGLTDESSSDTAASPVAAQQGLALMLARLAATEGAVEVRWLTTNAPETASDIAPAISDLLVGAVRLVEGRSGGLLTQAADDYDRASREPWGAATRSTPAGYALRSAARLLSRTGRLRRAGPDHAHDLQDLLTATAGLVDAVMQLRVAQGRHTQAVAARDAAAALRLAAASAGGQRLTRRPGVRHGRTTASRVGFGRPSAAGGSTA